jgi:transglutaminase-like putative cysteine protease/lipoprotein NlpI
MLPAHFSPMSSTFSLAGATRFAAALTLTAALASTWVAPVAAQPARPAAKPAAPAPAAAKPPPRPSVPLAAKPAEPLRSGKGWASGAIPAWVVEPPAAPSGTAAAPNVGGRREPLVDVQSSWAHSAVAGGPPVAQTFVRYRTKALDAAALNHVSQPQLQFNPAFSTLVLHTLRVWRDGVAVDKLADARIELMRREQRLEQLVLDGNETLLAVPTDVRLGDIVEVAYTIVGDNPIFEGRISTGMRLASETPIDTLHWRLTAPAGRSLVARPMATDIQPERSIDAAGRSVFSVVRRQVAAIQPEQGMPPWFKLHPAVEVSEYADWAAVEAWAARLFALPSPAHASIQARAREFAAGGKQGGALVSEVLRFVQDEVRYLSVSLGESSHRPKPPEQTLAERIGDCKDKTMLLNALLRELGCVSRPALVSVLRNRGLLNFLPGHDEFDHVVSAVEIDGRRWYLDGTATGQGLTLESRGRFPFGAALVVGAGQGLQAVPQEADALDRLQFEQQWNLADAASAPGGPTRLTATLRAQGLAAERWRAGVAAVGVEKVAESISGGLARAVPGLVRTGAAEVADDRVANELVLTQRFEHPNFARYSRGAIGAEYTAFEIMDTLVSPPEAQRRTPFLVDHPQRVDSRIRTTGVLPPKFQPPPPFELADRHFRFTNRVEIQGASVLFERRVERRSDQVLPADLGAWRENLLKARAQGSSTLRLAVVDFAPLEAEFARVERRVRSAPGWRNDALSRIVVANEFHRIVDGAALARFAPKSPLAAQARASRAQAANLLGQFDAGLADAEAALEIQPSLDEALEARAVALVGLGRADEALPVFALLLDSSGRSGARNWMAHASFHLGRFAEAEKLLREVVDSAGGPEREFALIWLFLAAERQGAGRGKAAIAPHVDGVEADKLSGTLLRWFNGSLDRDAVMARARTRPEDERLDTAEATFFIAHRLLAEGQNDEALRWFERTVQTRATPYREVTLAALELKRAGRDSAARP